MKISVYIATSLHGFIARKASGLDWLPRAQEGVGRNWLTRPPISWSGSTSGRPLNMRSELDPVGAPLLQERLQEDLQSLLTTSTIMCERAIMSDSWGGMLRGTTKNYGGIGPWMPVVPGLPKKEKTPAAPAYL